MTNFEIRKLTTKEKTVLSILVAVSLLVGYIQSAAWMNRVGWDTVSYLELSDAFRTQNWSLALSPYWSPLYPIIIALAKPLAPVLVSERALLCVIQYLSFLLYMGASALFWRAVLIAHEKFSTDEKLKPLPRLPLITLMVAISMLSCLVVGDLAVKGPDMLSAAIYLAANALIVSCLYQPPGMRRALFIGVLMGLAYLAKAFFISWIFPCLALLAWQRKRFHLTTKHLTAAAIVCISMIALYAIPLSLKLGHPSLGESGKYQIAFSSNERILPMVPMVHGARDTKHPSNLLSDNPTIYEFTEPFDVAYPPWFDPHYWNEGLRSAIDWKLYSDLLVDKALSILFGFAIYLSLLKVVFAISGRSLIPYSTSRLLISSPVWLTSLFCSMLYLFLSAAVPRYFMGFVPTMFAGIFLAYRSRADEAGAKREGLGMWIVTVLLLVAFTLKSLMHTYFFVPQIGAALSGTNDTAPASQAAEPHSATANKLAELGLKPRDRIMRIAKNEGGEYYWARLADVRIVAECVDPQGFFSASPERRSEIYESLKKYKVKAIVLDWTNRRPTDEPPKPTEPGWQSVTGTKNSILVLQ